MPAPLLLVICIIGFTVFVIVIETIVTSINNIVTRRSNVKPPLSSIEIR